MSKNRSFQKAQQNTADVVLKSALSVWVYGVVLIYLILNIPHALRLLFPGFFSMFEKLQHWLLQFFTAGYLS
jgi:hypothetical protein